MATAGVRTADETGIFIHSLFDASDVKASSIDAVIISSVVPDIMYSLTQGIRKYFHIEPMIVSAGMKTGISVKRDNPKGVGADRIVNLVAVNEIYGGPAVVIDYGTANTFDVLNEKSEFITGLITPGISVCADALTPVSYTHLSDQGFQYTSHGYFKLTQSYGILPSMSRRGNCYDNALAENFFGILKTECIYRHKPATFQEAKEMIDRYIHFYNHERIQLKTGVAPLTLRHST